MVSENRPQDDRESRRPAQNERFYIVHLTPSSRDNLCVLEDGSAVLCAIEDRADARIAALSHEKLEVVPHSQLSKKERRRVNEALQ